MATPTKPTAGKPDKAKPGTTKLKPSGIPVINPEWVAEQVARLGVAGETAEAVNAALTAEMEKQTGTIAAQDKVMQIMIEALKKNFAGKR